MLRNPLVRGLLIGLVVLVVVIVGGIQGVWTPQNREIARLQQEQTRLERELQTIARQEKEKEALEKEYARLMEQWNLLKDVLPQEEDLPGVLRLIHDAATRSGVAVVSVRPTAAPTQPSAQPAAASPPSQRSQQQAAQPQQPALSYRSHAYALQLRGTFYGIMDFALQLLRAERLGKVGQVQIRYSPEQKKEEGWVEYNVEANFVYTVYSFPEGGAP